MKSDCTDIDRVGDSKALETHNLSAGKNHPPEAGPSGGCLKFYETEKLGMRLSHKVSGDLLFIRRIRAFKLKKFKRSYFVLDFFLELFVELFFDPFFAEEYPSAYHPPPTNLNEQGDMIFLALRLHLGHLIALVPIGTRLSVMVPSGHWNS
jgi:hypothetical protein